MVGIKAILRTPVKTALFFLLIAVVTVFLSLGVGMLTSANRMLDEADLTFLTAGEFVFMGGRYPDAVEYDPELAKAASAFDFDAIAGMSQVLYAERSTMQRAYLDGYKPGLADMPYSKYAVMTISVQYLDSSGCYVSRVIDAQYASEDMEGIAIYVYPGETPETALEPGRKYIAFGGLFTVPGRNFWGLQILPFDAIPSLEQTEIPSVIDVTDAEDMDAVWQSDAGKALLRAAEVVRIINNSVDLEASVNVNAMGEFHRGEYTVTQGRLLEALDYQTGGVCLLPKRIASQLGLSVGDTVTLSVHFPSEGSGLYESYLPETGFAATEDFEIVGIYQASTNDLPIVIPNAGQTWLGHSENNYTLARVILDNRSAKDFIEKVAALVPGGVQFNVFDDGYAEAVRPIMGMRETAIMVTVVCAIACLLIVFFFGFFFVFRNKETARILWGLGTDPAGIYGYFLTGSGSIALLAAAAGGILGYFRSKRVVSSLYQSIVTATRHDLRFSLSAYGVAPDSFAPVPEILASTYGILAAAITALALLSCMFFTLLVIRAQNPFVQTKRKWKQAERQKRKRARPQSGMPRQAVGAALSCRLPTVTLRYAVRSMLRGGKRSGVVPLLFAVLLTFLCVFSGVRAEYQQQLANVYSDVPVTMQLSDISGRLMDGLSLHYGQITDVWQSGFVRDMAVSMKHRYLYMEVVESADGKTADVTPEQFAWPENSYVYETFLNQLDFLTKPLVLSSNVPSAPAFFYQGAPEFTFAQGKGWDTFYEGTGGIILPQSTLENEGLRLGDKISLVIFFAGHRGITAEQIELEIMGTCNAGADREEAYASISLYGLGRTDTPEGMEEWASNDAARGKNVVFHSAGYVLQNTDRLSELKDWLSQRYDALGMPGKYRQWIIVNDTALFSMIDTLTRHINYVNMVYPLAFLLVVGIGFLVSSLLLKSRAREIGVLQSVGTSRGGIFCNLFLEQALLSIPGIACGILLASLLQGGALSLYLLATLVFTACYFAGTALAIVHTYRNTTLKALAQKEE